ncbi:hypothetical protein LCGC14_2543210, partial [marine sediment metagenome]
YFQYDAGNRLTGLYNCLPAELIIPRSMAPER